MIKIDLARNIAEKLGGTQKDADAYLTAFIDSISESLENQEKVVLSGFGVFSLRFIPEHQGRNPKSGIPLTVPACYYPVFRAGKGLKDRVAKVQLVENPDTTPVQAEPTSVDPKPTRKKKANSAS